MHSTQDVAQPHYTTLDTDITKCIPHIAYTKNDMFTSDVNVQATLWYLYTHHHRDIDFQHH